MFHKIIREDIEYITNQGMPWDYLNGSNVLITGANGFLPSYLIETLLYLNDKFDSKINVFALARNKKKTNRRFVNHNSRGDLHFIFQDVCDPIIFVKDIRLQYIIHGASQASPKYYELDPAGTIMANVVGTINLLKIAQKNNLKRFLYFSTGGVLGKIDNKNIPAKEDDYGYLNPTNVKSCYNESKRMGENICASWFHQFGIPTVMIRPSYVYGPGMKKNDDRVFPSFIQDIIGNRNLIIKGNGKQTRSFCYIADAILGIFLVLFRGENGKPYNVGTENETSIFELANILVSLYPKKELQVFVNESSTIGINERSSINRSCLNISRIKDLGWKPTFNLKEGIKRTMRYYENN